MVERRWGLGWLIAAAVFWAGPLGAACTVQPPQALLRPGVSTPIPALPDLASPWNSSQLLTIRARGQQDQVQVEVDLRGGRLTLIALSPWGSRLMTVRYDGRTVETEVSELARILPPPSQILVDVLLVNWPIRAWDLPQGWRVAEHPGGLRVVDPVGAVVTEVDHPSPATGGEVRLVNHAFSYELGVRTLQGDLPLRH